MSGRRVLVEADVRGADGHKVLFWRSKQDGESMESGYGIQCFALHDHPGDWEIEHVADAAILAALDEALPDGGTD